jgi:non-specific serine/threonine protein kinase
LRHADYWTIRHRGHTTCLKATRGLHCLAFLLRHAGREFHVSELLASLMDTHAAMPGVTANASEGLVVAGLYDGCPRLDAQAKTEYKQRLNELREELHEAEQFNDGVRAAKAQEEMNAIAEHFAAAIGRGGRDRKTSSEAERARCAVTKRIKQAIQRIAEAIPDLGSHLAGSIKTGYFCSYNPHPDRPVAWKF